MFLRQFKCLVIIAIMLGGVVSSGLALDNPEQKLDEVIKKYIITIYPDWTADELKISYKFTGETLYNLKGLPADVKIKVLDLYKDFKPVGNVIFPLEISNGAITKKILVRAKVEIYKNIVVAGKYIKKGKVLDLADFKMEGRDIALLPPKYFLNEYQLLGKEAKIGIPANSSIFDWMIGDLPIIKRGSELQVKVAGGGLMVKAKAESLEDGYLNSLIKVRLINSKQTIKALVVSSSEVEVKVE